MAGKNETTVRVDKQTLGKLQAHREKTGIPIAVMVRRAVADYLEKAQ